MDYRGVLTKSEAVGANGHSPLLKSEVVFVTGIRATLQKCFANQGGVARPNYFDKSYDRALMVASVKKLILTAVARPSNEQ